MYRILPTQLHVEPILKQNVHAITFAASTQNDTIPEKTGGKFIAHATDIAAKAFIQITY